MDTLPSKPATVGNLMTSLGVRVASCAKHGEFESTGMRWRSGREIWSQCPTCEVERKAAEEAEQQRREAQRRAEERERRIGSAGIPLRFHGRTFENFIADTQGKRHALTVARDFAEGFRDEKRGAGLIFAGLPGTGKTHLAAAIMQTLVDRHAVQYLTCLGLVRAVRDTWRRESERSERELVRLLGEEIDLLVLDEIGATYGTEGEQTILFDVLDKRYAGMKSTLLLTNQDKGGFKTFVGDRVFDRLVETSRWVPFDWPSFRAAARERS